MMTEDLDDGRLGACYPTHRQCARSWGHKRGEWIMEWSHGDPDEIPTTQGRAGLVPMAEQTIYPARQTMANSERSVGLSSVPELWGSLSVTLLRFHGAMSTRFQGRSTNPFVIAVDSQDMWQQVEDWQFKCQVSTTGLNREEQISMFKSANGIAALEFKAATGHIACCGSWTSRKFQAQPQLFQTYRGIPGRGHQYISGCEFVGSGYVETDRWRRGAPRYVVPQQLKQ